MLGGRIVQKHNLPAIVLALAFVGLLAAGSTLFATGSLNVSFGNDAPVASPAITQETDVRTASSPTSKQLPSDNHDLREKNIITREDVSRPVPGGTRSRTESDSIRAGAPVDSNGRIIDTRGRPEDLQLAKNTVASYFYGTKRTMPSWLEYEIEQALGGKEVTSVSVAVEQAHAVTTGEEIFPATAVVTLQDGTTKTFHNMPMFRGEAAWGPYTKAVKYALRFGEYPKECFRETGGTPEACEAALTELKARR